jgi:TetR/AcrR family transcriptional regulator, transcriptional repressor of bet genes
MKTEATHSPLFASIFPRTMTRVEKRKIEILKATIHCYARLGLEQTTYEHIARRCGVSRTLVIHYFPERDELTRLAIRYVRADMQEAAINALAKAPTAVQSLSEYVRSTFRWIAKKPDYFSVWLMFYYLCGVREDFKQMHTELAQMGHDRIATLIALIVSHKGEPSKAIKLRAKSLQSLMTGALVTMHVENLSLDPKEYIDEVVQQCQRIAGGTK